MRFAGYVLLCLLPLFAQPDELVEKSRRAKELMAEGKFEEAVPLYSDLVRALPNNPGLIMNLGMALHLAGQDQKAIRQFETVLKLQPDHVPARLFLGAAYLRLGEPAKAVAPLERVLQAEPDNREARQMLADALLSLERFEQAAPHFQKLADVEPENPRAWYGLGACYEALATRAFEELETVAPESAYWLALVAASRARQQQYSSAFYLYRQALTKMPTMRGIHAALAEIYKKTGHLDWAAIEEEKERQMPPPDCVAEKIECDFLAGRYSELLASAKRLSSSKFKVQSSKGGLQTSSALKSELAASYYWQSRACNELALRAFSRLAQLPPSAEMHSLLAEIHRNRGRHLEAAKEWREALRFSPEDPGIQKELALALHLGRDDQGARPLLEELLKREPDSAELNFLLGDTLLSLQRAEEAVPYLKKAVERDPKLLAAHAALARAYLQIGRGELAVPHLKAALPIDKDGGLHYQLARAYQSSGQQELARQILEKYQEIRKSLQAERQALEQEVQITPP